MSRFRSAPRFERLVNLQEQYLDQVDALLGCLETPAERLASVEEIRRQIGCLMGEISDRKRTIQYEQTAAVIVASLNAKRKEP